MWINIKKFLIKISHVQASIIMGLVYVIFIGPIALLFQVFHKEKASGNKSYWIRRSKISDMRTYLIRQF